VNFTKNYTLLFPLPLLMLCYNAVSQKSISRLVNRNCIGIIHANSWSEDCNGQRNDEFISWHAVG